MHQDYRKWINFLRDLGIEQIAHTQKNYLAHLVNVYNMMETYGQEEELCRAGLFHSIYGTENFQRFKLEASRRAELAALIGSRAEKLAYWNCLMDRSSLDCLLDQHNAVFPIRNRESGEIIELKGKEFDDLCCVHLFDWLEQAPRSSLGWDYRRAAYRRMAQRVGDRALQAYDDVFSKEPSDTPVALRPKA